MEPLFSSYEMWTLTTWDWDSLPDALHWMCAVWRDIGEQLFHEYGELNPWINNSTSTPPILSLAFT